RGCDRHQSAAVSKPGKEPGGGAPAPAGIDRASVTDSQGSQSHETDASLAAQAPGAEGATCRAEARTQEAGAGVSRGTASTSEKTLRAHPLMKGGVVNTEAGPASRNGAARVVETPA